MQSRQRSWERLAVAVFLVVTCVSPSVKAQGGKARWVATWASSMQGLAPNVTLTNATVRMIARSTIGGSSVRVRLENTFGTSPLTIGAASVALRARLGGLVDGSSVRLTFGGSPAVTIQTGGRVDSDAAVFRVEPQQDMAVSLYVPGAGVPITVHIGALTTSYLTPNGAGNHAAGTGSAAFTLTTTSMYFVSSIDVLSDSGRGAIVAFGDSITDGTCATLDGHDRWEDVLALRRLFQGTTDLAVINAGIGGNTVTRENLVPPPNSPPAIERLDRDVLERAGATHVILFEGTNDIRRGASAQQVIAGLQDVIRRLKTANLKVIGATIIPRHNVEPTPDNSGWDSGKTAIRNSVNEWIRRRAGFDAVLDFDEVVRKADNHDLIDPAYNCGDGIHPGAFGYLAMGRSIALEIFQQEPGK